MSLGRKRRRPDETVYLDVMVALSVLMTVGLLVWTYLVFSIVPSLPHYPRHGLGLFREFWAGNAAFFEQPLTMFTATLLSLTAYLYVLFITSRGTASRRLLPERTILAASFFLIAMLVNVTGALIDIVVGGHSLMRLGGIPSWLLPNSMIGPRRHGSVAPPYLIPEPYEWPVNAYAHYTTQIGGKDVFLADADTIRIGPQDYRLWGIDALQSEQICVPKDGRPFRCGAQAREALLKLMTSVPPSHISCFYPDQARYPRTISCRAGETDVAEWLVRQGYAFPTEAGQFRYGKAMREAKAQKSGAWATTFLLPWQWKAARCRATLSTCRNDD